MENSNYIYNTSKTLSFHGILLPWYLVYKTFYKRWRFINFANSPYYRWRNWSTKHLEQATATFQRKKRNDFSRFFFHVIALRENINSKHHGCKIQRGRPWWDMESREETSFSTDFKPSSLALQIGVNPRLCLIQRRFWYNHSICILTSSSAFCLARVLFSKAGSHTAQTNRNSLLCLSIQVFSSRPWLFHMTVLVSLWQVKFMPLLAMLDTTWPAKNGNIFMEACPRV